MSWFSRLFGRRPPEPAPVADPEERFVRGEAINCDSSNVEGAYYERDRDALTITFHSGSSYQYYQVSEAEARDFFRARSKGSFVWDRLRIRGTVDGHRKSFVRLS